MEKLLPIVWLTGNSGAGKTTLAQGLKSFYDALPAHPLYRKVLILDGDEMRASISMNETFTPEDRRRHNLRVARLATVMRSQGFLVIVSVIAPFEKVRAEIDDVCQPCWVYLKRSNLDHADRPYEPPTMPQLMIDNDINGIDDTRRIASEFLGVMLEQKSVTTLVSAH